MPDPEEDVIEGLRSEEGECTDPDRGQWLTFYVSKELTRPELGMFQEHLAVCPYCSASVHNWNVIIRYLKEHPELRDRFSATLRTDMTPAVEVETRTIW